MAARNALVLVGGSPAELPAGDTLNGVAGGGVVAPVAARIRRSTNQSIASGAAWIDLSWDSSVYQANGTFWTSGATVTIPETGYYQVFVEATFDGAGLIGTINGELQVVRNGGAAIAGDFKQVFVNTPASLFVMAQRLFTAGDTLTTQVKHSNATAVNILAEGDHSPDIIVTKLTGAKGDAGPAGGATAGGATTQIQYNSAGVIAGDADLTWDAATNKLTMAGADTGIIQGGITNEPANPPSNTLHYYTKKIAGRMFPKVKGPIGLDYSLQASIWGNAEYVWRTSNATAGLWTGTVGAGAGTFSGALPTETSVYTSIKRARYANVVTTLNQVLGQRNAEAVFFRGSLAGRGGFFFKSTLGFDTWTNGGRFFAGMHTGTTVVSADPSALNNTVGFCIDAADNGAVSFLTRGTVATKAATGLTAVSGKGYEVYIFCVGNGTEVYWRILDINTGVEASGTATLNLPVNTTMLTAGVLASNAALATVTAINLGVSKIYVETDY